MTGADRSSDKSSGEAQDSSAEGSWKNWARLVTAQLVPPRAPSPQDGELMLDLAGSTLAANGPLSVIVLGVTRAIVHLEWPTNVELLSLDSNPDMIEAVWVPHPVVRSQATLSGWEAMPVASGSVDLVVGDCSFNACSDLALYSDVARECARVLKPQGKAILRFFAPEEPRKTPLQAIADARISAEGRLSHVRLDLAMAISGLNGGFVNSAEIKRVFDELVPDRAGFARQSGATQEEVFRVIDLPAREFPNMVLNYFTVSEIRRNVQDWLVLDEVRYPSYLMGNACPTLRFSPAS